MKLAHAKLMEQRRSMTINASFINIMSEILCNYGKIVHIVITQ